MLHVFVKYGRPVEEDTMMLFRNKLEELYNTRNDPMIQSQRRISAVNEIVNHRIEAIVRTMTSYIVDKSHSPYKDMSDAGHSDISPHHRSLLSRQHLSNGEK